VTGRATGADSELRIWLGASGLLPGGSVRRRECLRSRLPFVSISDLNLSSISLLQQLSRWDIELWWVFALDGNYTPGGDESGSLGLLAFGWTRYK
jgi:hypothetical protein